MTCLVQMCSRGSPPGWEQRCLWWVGYSPGEWPQVCGAGASLCVTPVWLEMAVRRCFASSSPPRSCCDGQGWLPVLRGRPWGNIRPKSSPELAVPGVTWPGYERRPGLPPTTRYHTTKSCWLKRVGTFTASKPLSETDGPRLRSRTVATYPPTRSPHSLGTQARVDGAWIPWVSLRCSQGCSFRWTPLRSKA